jgi:ring-1,2-phenylacetyl-CoA epoxidase subunit PaaC
MELALATDVRESTRDLILILADSKRLLGMRYAGWILGAPELEAGIACASMAQDEWGHGRLLYALLKDFGDDPDRLEHARDAAEYRNIGVLDREPGSWPHLVAINALVDTALTVQFEALRESSYAPIRQRVEKLLDEERFHAAHGAAWFRRLARAGGDSRDELTAAVAAVLPAVLRWFGPDSTRARALQGARVSDAAGSTLRTRFLERVAPLLADIEAADLLASIEPDFAGFDEATRRAGGAPDADTITKVRGDRNRAFLLD